MEIGKTLYVKDRKSWRAWLSKNGKNEKAVWLIYYRKSSGKPRIPYNDAVEEALCFGWIDSTVKKIDAERFAQRFTPRRKTSGLSQMNLERVRRMISEGRMTGVGLAAVSHVFKPGFDSEKFPIARDILAALRKDTAAWTNFKKLPEVYKRIRIGYLEDRRSWGKEAFRKSLGHFVKMTAKGKRFGFGGIEKYF